MLKCLQNPALFGWDEVLGNCLKWDVICKIAWGSSVYNLSRYRNDIRFGNNPLSKERIFTKDLLGG